MILRALHGLTGDEIAAGVEVRNDALCYNCEGQCYVFPGMLGKPMTLDTSRILKCPTCGGTGKRPPQMPLF